MAETMEWEATSVEEFGSGRTAFNVVTAQNVMDIIMMDVETEPIDDQSKCQIVVVPDTNIFIHSLRTIRELLEEDDRVSSLSSLTPPLVVLPWMVLQELDGLRKKNRAAQVAINYINELLVKKHLRLRPQRPSEVAESSEQFPGSNEDDSILQCALSWCRKLTQGKIVFITNDKNLRSKAMVTDIANLFICDGDSAFTKVRSMSQISNPSDNPSDTLSDKRSTISRSRSRSKSDSDNHHRPPPRSKLKRGSRSPPKSSKEISSRKRQRSPSHVPRAEDEQTVFSPLRKRLPKETATIPVSCSNFTEMTKVLCDMVSFIIEFQMKADFGENWLKCLKISPPWTFETGLKCILAHWIAVFSFVFGRMKKDVEQLYEKVRLHGRKSYRKDSEASSGTQESEAQVQEDILEMVVKMLNAAEFNKSEIIREVEFRAFKKAVLNFIQKLKEDTK